MPITISGSTGIAGVDGSASTPAVQGTDTNTGMFFPAADTIAFVEGGTEVMRIDSSGNVGIGTSSPLSGVRLTVQGNFSCNGNNIVGGGTSAATANITGGTTFSTDGAAIALRGSTAGYNNHGMEFYAGGTERARITSSGNLLVGTTTDNGSRLRVTGNAYFDNLVYSPGVYNQTTGSAANMHIATDGNFFRSTSSRKYKRDIQDATFGLSDVLALRPVTYKGKSEADGETVFGGLIAEEVHDAGLTQFVQYAEDGTPDAIAYGNMVALCIKAIQELKAENDDLKARLTALEAK